MRNWKSIFFILFSIFFAGFISDHHQIGFSNYFTVSKDSVEKKVCFKIIGMPFNRAEGNDIHKLLSKQPGVIQCAVTFEVATARLVIDTRKTDSFKLAEVIEGYKADRGFPRYHAVEIEDQ
ncbi:hypothetical protein [Solitalea koreensis]|uniref:HMA domain-containing protein n=1 Tax=Solitalea koreensis TaxID=543615 RepID=A0A521AL20_9SPHI|nr:hypothetical protein [Solitalea koreensis]SMO35506.1 hypothetical protein SAMN06265350_101209 [Solitalea koreensis]